MKAQDANRFAVMTNIDYANLEDADYPARAAAQVETDIKAGAIGLKVWKHLGMMLNDSKGRIKVDDPAKPRRILTVWGRGYKFVATANESLDAP